MSSVPRVCSTCGAAAAWDARFCQQCGGPLEHDARSPRYYGALSPGPAFVLGAILLLAGVIALLAGSVIAAIALIAFALAGFVLFYESARRNSDDPVARRVLTSARHLRGWTAFARASASAWVRAARDVLRLRSQSRSLRREREQSLRSLGDAAYREDEPLVTALRARLREIDDELAKREAARAKAVAAARRHVDEELVAARPTQRYSVDEIASGGKQDE